MTDIKHLDLKYANVVGDCPSRQTFEWPIALLTMFVKKSAFSHSAFVDYFEMLLLSVLSLVWSRVLHIDVCVID